jgi:hypothetical protein
MSRQVRIQTKLQDEDLVVSVLQEDLKIPFYFRDSADQRKLCIESSVGPIELICGSEGFHCSEEQAKIERFQPFLNQLQQKYALARIKKLALQAGYRIETIKTGTPHELVVEVSPW